MDSDLYVIPDHVDGKHDTESSEISNASSESTKMNHDKIDHTDRELVCKVDAEVLSNVDGDEKDNNSSNNTDHETGLRRNERSNAGNLTMRFGYDG